MNMDDEPKKKHAKKKVTKGQDGKKNNPGMTTNWADTLHPSSLGWFCLILGWFGYVVEAHHDSNDSRQTVPKCGPSAHQHVNSTSPHIPASPHRGQNRDGGAPETSSNHWASRLWPPAQCAEPNAPKDDNQTPSFCHG